MARDNACGGAPRSPQFYTVATWRDCTVDNACGGAPRSPRLTDLSLSTTEFYTVATWRETTPVAEPRGVHV
ncbi:hypothetical protein J6590_013058 [Homalodisca vitripennis]|nr:hypothetical protein J6590_013058 [Homalodisca vitripennis]